MNNSEKPFSCELPKSSSHSKDFEKSSSKDSSLKSLTESNKTEKHASKRKRSLSNEHGSEEKKCKKHKRKHKKKCKKRHRKNKEIKKLKSDDKHGEVSIKPVDTIDQSDKSDIYGPEIPDEISLKAQAMAPMSKEKWDEKNNSVHRVFDEETGRNRLVKGDGEVIEEIVSRKRHYEINKQTTYNSGAYFQAKLSSKDLP